jgi:hypothetical protein
MNHAPGKKHWRAPSDDLRYLATSGDARIIYQRTNEPCCWYVDSDFLPNYGTIFDNRRSLHRSCQPPSKDHCHEYCSR